MIWPPYINGQSQYYNHTIMNSYQQLSEYEFERVLTPEVVRVFQIIQSALLGGATMFALVVLLLHSQHTANGSGDVEVVNILSIINALFAIGVFGISRMLFERMFADQQLNNSISSSAASYEQSLATIRAAIIIRMALLEGAAFFGLVVCMIAVTGGITQQKPEYLFNMASYLLFMLIGINTFPTKNALQDIFRKNILKKI